MSHGLPGYTSTGGGGDIWDTSVAETVELDWTSFANEDIKAKGDGVVDAAGYTGLFRNFVMASATSADITNGTGLVCVGFPTGTLMMLRGTNVLTEWDPELDAIEFTQEYTSLSVGTRSWWPVLPGPAVVASADCGYYQEGGGPAGGHEQAARTSYLNTPSFVTGAIRIRQENAASLSWLVYRGTSVSTLTLVCRVAGSRIGPTNGPWDHDGSTYKPEFALCYPVIGTGAATLTKSTIRRARF